MIKGTWSKALSSVVAPDEIERVEQILVGGSERNYFRIWAQDKTYILQETSNLAEFRDYISIGNFLYQNEIAVPRILAVDEDKGIAVIEDAGNFTLQTAVTKGGEGIRPIEKKELCHKSESITGIIEVYQKILRELIKIQKIPISDFPTPVKSKKFDFDYYRWETDYFLQNCILKFFSPMDLPIDRIKKGFNAMAEVLQNEPDFPVHRDFQSQNILLKGDGIFIIDFQSARIGSSFYDVASLLKDPYVELPPDIHDYLFDYYLQEQMKQGVRRDLSPMRAREIYSLVSVQRLMQALGAYGNLGFNKGKKDFIRYISPAARLLYATIETADVFPEIKAMVALLWKSVSRFFR